MALIGTMKYLTIGDQTYEIAGDELQIASASTLGGIKVGSGLSIDATTGVLSTSITETDPTVPSWAKASTKPTYTYSEVGAAASSHSHGNITNGGDITATAPTIANGDQIIINDNSASKITNGPTFDGSTTTKALTPKGTWETFLQSFTESDPVFAASAAAGITSTDISNWNSKTSNTGTVTQVTAGTGLKIGSATSGGNITTSGTINHINSVTAQTTQAVYPIKIDAQGHISGYGSAVTVPTKTSELTNDSGYITSYVDEKVKLNSNTDSSLHYMVFGPSSVTDGNTYSLYYNSGFSFTPSTGNLQALKFNGYTLAGASAKSVDSSISNGSSSTNLPTSAAVASFVEGKGYITTYTDTKNTAGSTNSASTLYLIGATSQGDNPQTYSNSSLFLEGGILFAAGGISLTSSGSNYNGNITATANLTSSRNIEIPDKSGIIALTSDLPTKTSDLTNDSGFITTYTDEKLKWTASTSSNTYYPLQSTSTATTSTANTLNGINFYQYYNTAGGYRRLNLGNSTAWKSTGGAYGTIRLYGAAATYYGDLVPGVLGTTSGDGHISANRTWTLPDKTGTLAITDDIPSVGFSSIQTNSAIITLNGIGYTFLRSYTETDPIFSASAASGITATDISNWNAKSNTDEKLKTVALTSGTTYYPILATGANAAANRQVDSTLLGLQYISTAGTTSTVGTAVLRIGNGTSSGYADNEQGVIRLYGTSVYYTDLVSGALLSNKTITLPNGTGTLALTSDIVQSNWSEANTNAASYIQNKPTIPSISLNGSSTTSASFYAPTTAGTSGYYLKSSGSGAPTWAVFPTIPTDTNTTYTLTNALSSHKFTWTFTAGGSGSGSTTTTAELVAGTGITLTDDTTNKKITIASSVTNTDEKLKVEALSNTTTAYYPILTTSTTSAENKQYSYLLKAYFNDNSYNSYNFCIGNGVGIKGRLILANTGSSGGYTSIDTSGTTDRIITLPDKTGTIALTSDIPTVFVGSTSSTNGTQGLVPAPLSTDTDKYLKADGTWDIPAARWV